MDRYQKPALALGLTLLLAATAQAQVHLSVPNNTDPAPPLLSANILAAETLQGQNWVVDPQVGVQGYKYLFRLRTPYGEIPALGMGVLEKRIRELLAIQQLAATSGDPNLVRRTLQNLQGPGNPPLVFSPEGMPLRGPQGFAQIALAGNSPSQLRVGSKSERQMMGHFGLDPETDNPILRGMLNDISQTNPQVLQALAERANLQPELPGLRLLEGTPQVDRLVTEQGPEAISGAVNAAIAELGADPYTRQKFARESLYTTRQRLVAVRYLNELRGVQGTGDLINSLAEAETEAEGLDRIQQIRMLAELHLRSPLVRVHNLGLPIAETNDGSLHLITSADFVPYTGELVSALAALRQKFPNQVANLVAAGQLSPRATQLAQQYRFEVQDYMREGLRNQVRLKHINGLPVAP